MSDPNYLRLASGELIDTSTGKRVVSTDINNAFSDQPHTSKLGRNKLAYDGGVRRYIDDLPGPPSQTKAIAAVSALALFGLTDADIGYILNTSTDIVSAVKDSSAYVEFMNAMLQNIREHDKDKVRKKINDAAEKAASRITTFVDHPDSKIALAAAKDVLDRAANGAYQGDNGNSKTGSLTIRIINDKENPADQIKVEIDG